MKNHNLKISKIPNSTFVRANEKKIQKQFEGGVSAFSMLAKTKIRRPWTLTLCLAIQVDMTNGNFLQTCIKNSLLQAKTVEILG